MKIFKERLQNLLSSIIRDIKINFMTQDQYDNNEAVFARQFLIGTSRYHLFQNKIKSNNIYLSVMSLIPHPVYENYNSIASSKK